MSSAELGVTGRIASLGRHWISELGWGVGYPNCATWARRSPRSTVSSLSDEQSALAVLLGQPDSAPAHLVFGESIG
jgi:hypothetical protein